MVMIKTVEKKIWDTEGFDVVIKKNGKDLRGDKQGVHQYNRERASKNSMSASNWKNKFQEQYPGLEVDVLDGNGDIINAGQTLLGTVRDSYTSEDE